MGRETYLGWREITKRQEHVRKAREKLKEKHTNDKKKNKEKVRSVMRRKGECDITLQGSSSGWITKTVRTQRAM